MTEAWRKRPYHRAKSALNFPEDEGWHYHLVTPRGGARARTSPLPHRMEWVYLNAHVTERGPRGRRFVVFLAYFTQGLRFFVVRAWDAEDRYLGHWTGTALGALRAAAGRLDVEFRHGGGVDAWRATGDDFSSTVEARDDAGRFGAALDLTNTKIPYEAGGVGFLPFARRGSFYYWSLTRLAVAGRLELDGEAVEVEGIGWFDHQWGAFFVTPFRNPFFEQYEWMSVQLDTGDDLMLTTVWDPKGNTPSVEAFGGAGLIRADGRFERVIGPGRWKRTRFWRAQEQGTVYSAGWTFTCPEWDIDLSILPRVQDQLTPVLDDLHPGPLRGMFRLLAAPLFNRLGSFWEGSCAVTGTFEGRPVKGVAFAELVKRYADPKVRVEVVRNDPGLAVLHWRVDRWDPEVPLRYRVQVTDGEGRVLHDRAGLDVGVAVLDDPALPRAAPLRARVLAASVDGTLRGESSVSITLR